MEQSALRIKHRTFTYSTDFIKVGHGTGMLSSSDKEDFLVSSPPEFKGEAGVWTPEDLFVGALESCTMLTFLALAGRKSLPVFDYTCTATGVLEYTEGKYSFTRITLKPRIVVEKADDREEALQLFEEAHKVCFVANSIRTEVILEPQIEVQ